MPQLDLVQIMRLSVLTLACAGTGCLVANPFAPGSSGPRSRILTAVLVGLILCSWLGILLAAMGLFRAPIVLALAVAGLAGDALGPNVVGAGLVHQSMTENNVCI